MALTAPIDACTPFNIEAADQSPSQSRNSKLCTVCSAFVLGMMVTTTGFLTVQHYGLAGASFTKFLFAPAVPILQPLPGVTSISVRAHLSNKKSHDLGRASSISLPGMEDPNAPVTFLAASPVTVPHSMTGSANMEETRRADETDYYGTGYDAAVSASEPRSSPWLLSNLSLCASLLLMVIIGGLIFFRKGKRSGGMGNTGGGPLDMMTTSPRTFHCSRASLTTIRMAVDEDTMASESANSMEYHIDFEINTPSFTKGMPLLESTYTQVMSSLDLIPIAAKLRRGYDDHFQDPRQPASNRFCWDPWYAKVGDGLQTEQDNSSGANEDGGDAPSELLEGEEAAVHKQTQYSLKRIQAIDFFNDDEFGDLVEGLTQLGRSIGLTAITPPWMSLYSQGDMQNFHTDATQGPCAFVLSLSNEGDFQGGETMLLKPQILELWRGFDGSKSLEAGGIMRYIPPYPLGQCIVFDPRVPHGVSQVTGTNDPRNGRISIHGWFNAPEVCWFGPWSEDAMGRMNIILDEALQPLVKRLGSGDIGRVLGYLACRVEVDADGSVKEVYGVCDTLQPDCDFRCVIAYDSDRPVMEDAVNEVKMTVYAGLMNLQVEEGESNRSVVVPFLFE